MAADPNYSNVSLLLHFNGADEGTTFTDNSPNVHTITRNGSANTEQSDKKWGTASGEFAWGSNSSVTAPEHTSFVFGSGDFTIECWAKADGTAASNQNFIQKGDSSVFNPWALRHNSTTGAITLDSSSNGSSFDICNNQSVGTLTGGWDHIAVTRSGSTWSLYINGTRTSTFTSSATVYANGLATYIGGWGSSGAGLRLDDVRITKGVARYTGASYTVPTAAFPDTDTDDGQAAPQLQPLTAAGYQAYGQGLITVMTGQGAAPAAGAGTFAPMTALAGIPNAGYGAMPALTGQGYVTGAAPSFLPLVGPSAIGDTLDYGLSTLEPMSASGEGGAGSVASSNRTDLAEMTATGEASAGSVSTAAVSLPALTAVAYGLPNAAPAFAAMTAAAAGLTGGVAYGTAQFPLMVGAVASTGGSISLGTPRFQGATASARSAQTSFAAAAVALQRMVGQASGTSAEAQRGSGLFKQATALAAGYAPSQGAGSAQFQYTLGAGLGQPVLADTFRTFSVNAGSGATTEYQAHAFNSYAEVEGLRMAVGPGGLYSLDGADDAGAAIAWKIRTGFHDDKKAMLKSLEEVLLAARYDGPLLVRVWTDENTYFDYNVSNFRPDVLQQVRAKLGRGTRSRFFRVEVSGVGNVAAEISGMTLPMVPLGRRVG